VLPYGSIQTTIHPAGASTTREFNVKDCFVIMPIGSGDALHTFRNRYEQIIKPAVESVVVDGEQQFQCRRADDGIQGGSITADIWRRLYRSSAVIADLSNRTFAGPEDYLRSRGVTIHILNDDRCYEILLDFRRAKPKEWDEDIGLSASDGPSGTEVS
jgi:hypothetical protein